MRSKRGQNQPNRSRGRAPIRRPAAPAVKAKKQPRWNQWENPRKALSMDHECATHYYKASANPFDIAYAGACVPMLPCLDSVKRYAFARGTGMVQSNGFGGICATPCVVGDATCINVTSGTGSQNSLSSTSVFSYSHNSGILTSSFTSGEVQARIVACGIRIRFRGKPLEANGTVYALEEPSHLDTASKTFQEVGSLGRVKNQRFGKDWIAVTWQPVLPQEYEYSDDGYAKPRGSVVNPLCILISADSPNGTLPFDWEYFVHYEGVGAGIQGKTQSHLAPVEAPRVIAALSGMSSDFFSAVSNGHIDLERTAKLAIRAGSAFGSMLAVKPPRLPSLTSSLLQLAAG